MKIKIKGTEKELKFTYNSFRYMGDLDLTKIGKLETNPFNVIEVTENLLLGALNNNPSKKFTLEDVQKYLEKSMDDGTLFEVAEELMGLLENSSFFQNLQGEEVKKKVVQAKKE